MRFQWRLEALTGGGGDVWTQLSIVPGGPRGGWIVHERERALWIEKEGADLQVDPLIRRNLLVGSTAVRSKTLLCSLQHFRVGCATVYVNVHLSQNVGTPPSIWNSTLVDFEMLVVTRWVREQPVRRIPCSRRIRGYGVRYESGRVRKATAAANRGSLPARSIPTMAQRPAANRRHSRRGRLSCPPRWAPRSPASKQSETRNLFSNYSTVQYPAEKSPVGGLAPSPPMA